MLRRRLAERLQETDLPAPAGRARGLEARGPPRAGTKAAAGEGRRGRPLNPPTMPSPPSPPQASPAPPAQAAAPASEPRKPRGLADDPQNLPIDTPGERNVPLPHERDEAPDRDGPAGTEPSQRAVGEQARRDLEQGREDTDRGPVTERVYEGVRRRER